MQQQENLQNLKRKDDDSNPSEMNTSKHRISTQKAMFSQIWEKI